MCRGNSVNRFTGYSNHVYGGAMVDSWLSFMHIQIQVGAECGA